MSEGGGHAVGLEGACEAFRRLLGLNLENGLGSQRLGSLVLVCVFYTSLGLCETGILTGRSLDLRFPARSLCCAGKRHEMPSPPLNQSQANVPFRVLLTATSSRRLAQRARAPLGRSFGLRQQSAQAAWGPHLYPLLLPSLEGVRPGPLGVLPGKDMEFLAAWPSLALVCAHTLC